MARLARLARIRRLPSPWHSCRRPRSQPTFKPWLEELESRLTPSGSPTVLAVNSLRDLADSNLGDGSGVVAVRQDVCVLDPDCGCALPDAAKLSDGVFTRVAGT